MAPLSVDRVVTVRRSPRPLVLGAALLLALVATQHAAEPELHVFFGNLHSHTALSDGSGTPAEAYAHARDVAGLDFLAITEHNHAQAGDIAENPMLYVGPGDLALIPTANRFTEEGRFIALYGQEFSTISAGNHVNVIDAPAVIDAANGDFRRLLEEWLPAHLDTQGQEPLVLLNHPANSNSPNSREYGADDFGEDDDVWLAALDQRAELINLVNGSSNMGGTVRPGKPSESEFRRYLNLGLHVAPTADQDNHERDWGSATEARTGIVAPMLTKAALLTAMKQRHVYASEDRNLRLIYRLNDQLLGSRIVGAEVPAPGTPLTVSLTIEDDDEPTAAYTVEVFSDRIGGTEVTALVGAPASFTGNGTHTITGVTYEGGAQYVYLRIHQADGDRAWTAPVWLEPDAGPGGDPARPARSVMLEVDEQAEIARITNTGSTPVELEHWSLVSVRGNQVFDQFPADTVLNPGESLTITSGPTAHTGPGVLRWTTQNIWSNSGDPGRLFDADGVLVAETRR